MSDLRARILADVRATPSRTRREEQRRSVLLVGIALAASLLVFFGTGGIVSGGRPMPFVVATTTSALVVGGWLVWLAGARQRAMLGRSRSVLVVGALLAIGLLAGMVFLATSQWLDSPGEAAGHYADVACGALTFLQAAVPLLALMLWRSGTDPIHPRFTGAVLGGAAGAMAASMAYLRCPHTAEAHLLVAHVAPTLVLTAVGAVIGYFALRLRRK